MNGIKLLRSIRGKTRLCERFGSYAKAYEEFTALKVKKGRDWHDGFIDVPQEHEFPQMGPEGDYGQDFSDCLRRYPNEPTRTERLQSRWQGVNRPLSLKDFRRRLKATSKIPHGDGKTFSTYLDTITLGGPLYSVITAHAFALLGIINDDDEVRFALPVSQSEHAGSYKFFKQSIGLNFDQANSYMTTLAKKYENTVMDLPEPSVERFEMTACKISITAVGTDFQSLAAPQKITRIELPTLMPGAAKKSTKPIDTASEGIDSLFAKELTRGLFFHKTLPSDKTLQERRQKGEDGRVNKTAVKKFEKAYMAKCKASFDAWKQRLLTIPDPKGTGVYIRLRLRHSPHPSCRPSCIQNESGRWVHGYLPPAPCFGNRPRRTKFSSLSNVTCMTSLTDPKRRTGQRHSSMPIKKHCLFQTRLMFFPWMTSLEF